MELTGRTALVTGGARRVGKAIALELARRGAAIVVHYGSSAGAAEETVAEIESLGTRAWAVQADLREVPAIDRLFAEIAELGAGLDVLVNSAASFERAPFEQIEPDAWDEVLALNLRAPFLCMQRAAPMMRESGSPAGGAVVNISDLSGVTPWKRFAHHGTSKAGLIHLTRVAAAALAPGIRVNCVVPGAILPPPGMDEDSETWRKLGESAPLKKTGDPEGLARAVAFLISNDFITGAVLPVDGGEHMSSPRAVL